MQDPTIWQDFIAVYDDALSPEFCQRLIKEFNDSDKRAPGVIGNGLDVTKKNSEDIPLNFYHEWTASLTELSDTSRPFVENYLRKLIFPLIGVISPTIIDPSSHQETVITPENFESVGVPITNELVSAIYRYGVMKLQKYQAGKGGYFHWHSEVYPIDAQCEALHRVLFFMFYLNDVVDGGETEFYYQKLKVKPKTGRMVIAPAGFTHTHRGNMPISSDKYIVTCWLMFNRAEQLFPQLQISAAAADGPLKRLYKYFFG